MNAHEALKKAIELAGGQASLGRLIGRRQQLISYWLNHAGRCAPDAAIRIEAALGGVVTREQLRPDLYEQPVEAAE